MTLDDLQEISDRLKNDDERRIVRVLLEKTFPEMHRFYQEKLDEIITNIRQESIPDLNQHEIAITVCSVTELDLISDKLFPMKRSDTDEKREIRQSEEVLFPVFIMADDKEIQEEYSRIFHGTIIDKEEEYSTTFHLQKDDSYKEIAGALKKAFVRGGFRWTPLNSGYLEKFYYIVADLPEEWKEKEEEDHYSYKLSDFPLPIAEQIVPIWNVERVTIQSNDFPTIQENRIRYRYDFRVEKDAELIPDFTREQQGEFTRYEDHLTYYAENNDQKRFSFWKITRADWEKFKGERSIFTNGKKRALIGAISTGQIVHSPFELARTIQALTASQRIQYINYRVRAFDYYDHCQEVFDLVRASKEDGLLEQISRKDYLELEFENKGEPPYLYRNVIQYIVNMVQMEFREYQVIAGIQRTE